MDGGSKTWLIAGRKRTQSGDVDFVHRFSVRCFDDHGNMKQSRIGYQAAEGFHSDFALTDMVMAVDFAAECFFCVVRVNHLQTVKSDQPVEFTNGLLVRILVPDIVTGDEYM